MDIHNLKDIGETTKLFAEVVIAVAAALALIKNQTKHAIEFIKRLAQRMGRNNEVYKPSRILILAVVLLFFSPLMMAAIHVMNDSFLIGAMWIGGQILVFMFVPAFSRSTLTFGDAAFIGYLIFGASFAFYCDMMERWMDTRLDLAQFKQKWANENVDVAKQFLNQANGNLRQAEFNSMITNTLLDKAITNARESAKPQSPRQ